MPLSWASSLVVAAYRTGFGLSGFFVLFCGAWVTDLLTPVATGGVGRRALI